MADMIHNDATKDFVLRHRDDDVRMLALQKNVSPDVDLPFALLQIAGWQTARRKLPSWAAKEDIVYPVHLSMEQCSSEAAAEYKSRLITDFFRKKSTSDEGKATISGGFIDLTGGLGVDFSFIARNFEDSTYVEKDEQLCDIARHNLPVLGLPESKIVNADGIGYIRDTNRHFSLIFMDPARRDSNGGKVVAISDCTPDVVGNLDLLMSKTDALLVKLSPMLDRHKAVGDLRGFVKDVHIVSVDNECKELLLLLCNYTSEETKEHSRLRIICTNITGSTGQDIFSYYADEAVGTIPLYKDFSAEYLYEPNASIMKAGCFDILADRMQVRPVSNNSHLFVSDKKICDFPGRRFRILRTTSMNKKELRSALAGIDRANISTRNFPMKAEELKKKLKLKDGGGIFIFGTTDNDSRHLLFICESI